MQAGAQLIIVHLELDVTHDVYACELTVREDALHSGDNVRDRTSGRIIRHACYTIPGLPARGMIELKGNIELFAPLPLFNHPPDVVEASDDEVGELVFDCVLDPSVEVGDEGLIHVIVNFFRDDCAPPLSVGLDSLCQLADSKHSEVIIRGSIVVEPLLYCVSVRLVCEGSPVIGRHLF